MIADTDDANWRPLKQPLLRQERGDWKRAKVEEWLEDHPHPKGGRKHREREPFHLVAGLGNQEQPADREERVRAWVTYYETGPGFKAALWEAVRVLLRLGWHERNVPRAAAWVGWTPARLREELEERYRPLATGKDRRRAA